MSHRGSQFFLFNWSNKEHCSDSCLGWEGKNYGQRAPEAGRAESGYAAPAVAEAYGRARSLADRLDVAPTYLAPLLHGLWTFHLVRGNLKLALGLAEEMETLGRARDNLSASLLGKEEHGIVCFQCGEFTTARTLFEQCDALKDSTHRAVLAAWVVQDQHVQTLAFLAMTLACQGYIEQGRERLNKALPEARELRHALTLANALHWATFFETAFGSPNQAIQYAEEATSFSSEHGFPLYAAWGDIARGRSLTVLGHAQEGLDLITKGLSMHRATGAKIGDPAWLTIQAEAYGALGRPLEGLNCLDEATQIIDATEGRDSEAEMLRLRGDLLNATGDEAAAEESYHQAPAVARKQQAKSFELRAAMSMARLWRDQGKRNDARELLAPVYGWFTEGFDTRDLKEAKALLEELAA